MKKYFLLIQTCIIIAMLNACVPLKKSIYLQGDITKKLKDIDDQIPQAKESYKIKPNDNLYIRINSMDENSSGFLNNQSGETTQIENPMAASLIGYRVEDDGAIYLPYVGKVYVAKLTLDQVRIKIQSIVSKYLEKSSVTVKLLNDNITVIGEVQSPGRFLLYDEKITVLEAISLAGDMTDFANRKKVRLIRKVGDEQQMIELNTLRDDLLLSSYYYIKPGDVIYVEPRRLKSVSLSSLPIGLTLTIVNTALLLYTFYYTTILNQD